MVPVASPPMASSMLRERRRRPGASMCVASTAAWARVRGRRSPSGRRSTSWSARRGALLPVEGFDTIVELGVGDHDTRASRRESVTEAVGCSSPTPRRLSASTARDGVVGDGVRGVRRTTRCRSPRNRCCAPTPTFVFARQLASAEELVEEWRRAPTVVRSRSCDRRSPWPRTGRRRSCAHSPPASVTVSARTTRSPSSCTSTTWRQRRRAVGRATPRRRVQRRPGRLDPRRTGARPHR